MEGCILTGYGRREEILKFKLLQYLPEKEMKSTLEWFYNPNIAIYKAEIIDSLKFK